MPRAISDENVRRGLCAVLVLYTLLMSGRIAFWLYGLEYPLDFDSFYYLQEFKSMSAGGSCYYCQSGSVYLVSLAGAWLGLSDVQTFKCFVAASHLLAALGVCLLAGWRWPTIGVLCAVWMICSETFFLDSFSHPRQTLGLGLVIWGCVIQLCSKLHGDGKCRRTSAAALLLIILGAAAHGFAAFIALALIAFLLLEKKLQLLPGILLAFVVAGILAIDLAPRHIMGEWGPYWSDPFSMRRALLEYSSTGRTEFALMLAAVAWCALLAILSGRWRTVAPLALALLLCVLPLWNPELSLSQRVLSSMYWPGILFIALCGLTGTQRSAIQQALLAVLILLAITEYRETGLPTIRGPEFDPALLKRDAAGIVRWMGKDPIVIAPPGVHFRATYFLGVPSALSESKRAYANYFRIAREPVEPLCTPSADLINSPDADCLYLGAGWRIRRIIK